MIVLTLSEGTKLYVTKIFPRKKCNSCRLELPTWRAVEFQIKTTICLTEINRRTHIELTAFGYQVITYNTVLQLQLSIACR